MSAAPPARPTIRPTIHDVARAAAVSISTVSRALRGYRDVRPETRARVERAAHTLGYTPDACGQTLRSRQAHTVAVLFSGNHGPALLDHFYAEVLSGVQACLEAHGLNLLLVRAGAATERRALTGGASDGVIALGCDLPETFLQRLRGAGVPLVLADAPSWDAAVPSVSATNEAGGYLATRHLLRRGRRRVAFIAETPGNPNFELRRRGYARALAEAELPLEPALLQTGRLGLEGGYLAAQALLARARPDAIFAANDMAALGALRALLERGLRVPEDVAVVGFDDIELAAYAAPTLSTVRVPRQRLGHEAAQKLLALLGGRAPGASELPVALVPRASSGAPHPPAETTPTASAEETLWG